MPAAAVNRVDLLDLGRVPYRRAWDLQKRLQQRLIEEKLRARQGGGQSDKPRFNELLLFVEHPHVYTIGKSGNEAHLLKNVLELREIDAEFVRNDRGGDITYHGPGQIVGYPILDLDRHFTDIHRYLRTLEEIIIRTCADFGVDAERVEGLTGVWADGRKVCAMGIRCSRWVTMHGFALNVNTDLDYFDYIVPCGIQGKSATSLEQLTGRKLDEPEVRARIVGHFSDLFEVRCEQPDGLTESDELFSYLESLKT